MILSTIKIDIDTLWKIEGLWSPLDFSSLTDDDNLMEFLEYEGEDDYPTEEELLYILKDYSCKYLVIEQTVTEMRGLFSIQNKYSWEDK
jgi:hypothetical protein